MEEIQLLVLGNEIFADNLDKELDSDGIPHRIDTEIDTNALYDLCVCQPEIKYLEEVRDIQCGARIYVFNGVQMTNQALKNMVRMRINGFLEDHENPAPLMDVIRTIRKAKSTYYRVAEKIAQLAV